MPLPGRPRPGRTARILLTGPGGGTWRTEFDHDAETEVQHDSLVPRPEGRLDSEFTTRSLADRGQGATVMIEPADEVPTTAWDVPEDKLMCSSLGQ